MIELKVKCSSCGHLERVANMNTFTLESSQNEAFHKWLADHEKQIRDEVIDEFTKTLKLKCKKESLMDKDGFFYDVFHFDCHDFEIDEIAEQMKGE